MSMNRRLVQLLAVATLIATVAAVAGMVMRYTGEAKPDLEALGQASSRLVFDYMRVSNAKDARELKAYYAENVVAEYV